MEHGHFMHNNPNFYTNPLRLVVLHQDHVELHQRDPEGTGTIRMALQNIHLKICTGPWGIAPAEINRHQHHKEDTAEHIQ